MVVFGDNIKINLEVLIMEYKKFGSKYFLRLDKGEEIVENIKSFCEKENIRLGLVSGIGATNDVTVGLFLSEEKRYESRSLSGDFEIVPLAGNITTMNGEIYLHLHINLCDKENKSYGGHLNKAIVSATLEVVIDVLDGELDREFDDQIGLNLLKIN